MLDGEIYSCPINADNTCDFNDDETIVLDFMDCVNKYEEDKYHTIKQSLS